MKHKINMQDSYIEREAYELDGTIKPVKVLTVTIKGAYSVAIEAEDHTFDRLTDEGSAAGRSGQLPYIIPRPVEEWMGLFYSDKNGYWLSTEISNSEADATVSNPFFIKAIKVKG